MAVERGLAEDLYALHLNPRPLESLNPFLYPYRIPVFQYPEILDPEGLQLTFYHLEILRL